MQLSGKQKESSDSFSLYFHVPFCHKKCDYCHFYVIPDQEQHKSLYMKALRKEWERKAHLFKNKKLTSIFFGGGTPALLGPDKIATILSWIDLPSTSIEITLEANPENVSLSLMKGFRDAGINRISIGIQTFEDALLKKLGRTHSALQGKQAVYHTAQAGIENISIDLMFDLPEQSAQDWENTLCIAEKLPITHLSLYNLTIEPHTAFYKKCSSLIPQLPTEEISLTMWTLAREHLSNKGFRHYEISAFAKPGFESQHNLGYWTARPFLGLGPSAFSFWDNSRFRNISNLLRYHKSLESNEDPEDFRESLLESALQKELLALRLRLDEGISLQEVQQLSKETRIALEDFQKKGWLIITDDYLKPTPEGFRFHDTIASELIEI